MSHEDTPDVTRFFSRSERIWVSENFKNLILSSFTPREGDGLLEPLSFSDLKDTGTQSIDSFMFTDSDVLLEQLAELIGHQLDGQRGSLLTDSSANYFFLRAKDGRFYSILIRWEQAQRLWRCGAYLQDEPRMPNVRIFRPIR